jgi:hypothetical protein
MWSGMKSVGSSIVSWVKGLGSSILGAIKGVLGIASPSRAMYTVGENIMQGLENGVKSKINSAISTAKAAAAKLTSAVGVSNSSAESALKSAAAKMGWTGNQWTALYDVEMREAGFNLNAKNPSSGAYGMAQFINGPSEYAQYGGNATTAAGQAIAMVNYIAQRYGNPANAWAHEESYGWYSSGGATKAGWAMVGEHGRELIKVPGGATVYPHGATNQMLAQGSGGLQAVQLEISAAGQSDFEKFMLHAIRNWVRTKGGGDVQKAFGRT